MTEKEFETLVTLYDKATKRKIYIIILTVLAAITTANGIISLAMSDRIPGWMCFLGAGAAVVVYGVVTVFALLNDTVYDIATSIRPDFTEPQE